jgi:hypothetical protein
LPYLKHANHEVTVQGIGFQTIEILKYCRYNKEHLNCSSRNFSGRRRTSAAMPKYLKVLLSMTQNSVRRSAAMYLNLFWGILHLGDFAGMKH